MGSSSCVPPGFRFHPTEEELVGYYLVRKINSLEIDLDVIIDIDLYRMEPWDIQGKNKLLGNDEEQNEWYFFSHKDKKYPTGTRTNRATAAGFWKATGRDKAVLSKNRIIGMRKTLVFYEGRAPNGRKSDWIMHEYRLQTSELGPPQEEGWVVCRAFKKASPNPTRQNFQLPWNNHTYRLNNNSAYNSHVAEHDRHQSYPETVSATPISHSNAAGTQYYSQEHFNSSMQDPVDTRFEDHHHLSELAQLDYDPSFADWTKNMDSLISCSLSAMPSLIPDDDHHHHLLLDSTDQENHILQYFPDL